jgi:hypothetical protein
VSLLAGDRLGGGEEVTDSPMGVDSLTCEFENPGGKTSRRSGGLAEEFCSQFAPTQRKRPADDDHRQAF